MPTPISRKPLFSKALLVLLMQCLVLQPLLTYHAPADAQGAENSDGGEGNPDCTDPPPPPPPPDEPDDGNDGRGGGGTSGRSGSVTLGQTIIISTPPPIPRTGGTVTLGPTTYVGPSGGPGSNGTCKGEDACGTAYQKAGPSELTVLSLVSDGIDLSVSNKSHTQLDYQSGSASPITVQRIYNSNTAVYNARTAVSMGAKWRNYYDRGLVILNSTQVQLHRANGLVIVFNLVGGIWTNTSPSGKLTQVSGGWQYVNEADTVETYDSTYGRLLSLTTNGLVNTLQYDASNRLIRVANPFGTAITFGYDASSRVSLVTLPDATTLGYTYGANNNLASIRYGDNSVRQYVYENASFPNALTGVIDEAGRRVWTYGYDGAGKPNYGRAGAGTGAVSIAYSGNTASVTDARGAVRTRTFATVAGKPVLTNIQTAATATTAATGWSFGYDANGNPQTITTRSGEVQQITADSRGRITNKTRAAGTTLALPVQNTWHPTFNKPTQTTSLGVTTNQAIDGYGRVTQVTQTAAGSTRTLMSTVYNAQNLVQSMTDARGGTYSFGYDAAGNTTSVTNALGNTAYFQNFNAHGQPTRIQTADGVVTTQVFDTRGRVTSQTVAGLTTSYIYDAAGLLTRATAPDGSWLNYAYDSAGQLSTTTNNRSESIVLTRDAAGAVTQTRVYNSVGTLTKLSTKEINTIGQLTGVVDARGYRKQFSYAADGRTSGVIDAVGLTKSFQLDVLSRMTAVNQPNTAVVTQKNIALGKPNPGVATSATNFSPSTATVSAVVDVNSTATGYGYDPFNFRLAESNVDGGNKSVARNAAGDIVSSTDARGITLTVARDSLSRITSITPPTNAGTGTASFTYVAGRSDSLPASMTDGSGNTVWTYDAAGRMLTKQQTTTGGVLKATITRDALGRVVGMLYPLGTSVTINYAADIVSSVVVNGSTLMNNITYRPFSNQPIGWTWGNGTLYRRTFDTDGRVASATLGAATRSYAYDGAGRMSGFTDTGTAGTKASAFTYDEANQLIGYAGPGLTSGYALDTNGNRLSRTDNGAPGFTYSYVAGSNRIAAATSSSGATYNYAYNADSTVISIGARTFVHDAFGRYVSSISQPSATIANFANYVVNGLGQRVSKNATTRIQSGGIVPIAPAGTTGPTSASGSTVLPPVVTYKYTTTDNRSFFYDDAGQLLTESATVGDPSQEVVWFGGIPVAAVRAGVMYYIHADHLNTPRSLMRASDNAEMWRWDGEPFGNTYPTNPAGLAFKFNLRFPGQYYDTETTLSYNWMRYYDANTGRYIQADPIGLSGGNNRYGYVGGDPVRKTDPSGLYTSVTCWAPDPNSMFSLFGHITTNINGTNYSFGISGWENQFSTAVGYTDNQMNSVGRAGYSGVVLNLTPDQEARLEQCLKSQTDRYAGASNNCGRPIQTCLTSLGVTLGTFGGSILPIEVIRNIRNSSVAAGNFSVGDGSYCSQ